MADVLLFVKKFQLGTKISEALTDHDVSVKFADGERFGLSTIDENIKLVIVDLDDSVFQTVAFIAGLRNMNKNMKIAGYMKDEFLPRQYLKGIILGGPGTTVNNFLNKNHITGDVQKKILGVKDLSYTGDFGLRELVEKAEDILAKEDIIREKKLMKKFFLLLSTEEGKVAYGKDKVMELIKEGIADTVIISDAVDEKVIDEFEIEGEKMGTKVEIISTETTEGVQLRDMGKFVVILRYNVEK